MRFKMENVQQIKEQKLHQLVAEMNKVYGELAEMEQVRQKDRGWNPLKMS